MNKKSFIGLVLFAAVAGMIVWLLMMQSHAVSLLSIRYPFDNALFPPEFPAPSFEWTSKIAGPSPWEITLTTRNKKYVIHATSQNASWTPDEARWDSIKHLSGFDRIYFTVRKSDDKKIYRKISFRISRDSVGAPVMYRQMPLPSAVAEKRLDSMNFVLINFGSKNRLTLP